MLKELYIENLAVIQSAVIPLSENFNVFTGETGAGKSILINGINAVLGQRVTKDIVRSGSNKSIITALFTGLSDKVKKRLYELGIEFSDDEITVTREISADGGSIARINNRTSTVSVLRELGEMLINIHGQHDNQVLLAPELHTAILDGFGGNDTYLDEYHQAFKNLQTLARKLVDLKKEYQSVNQRMNYLESVIDELEPLELEYDEDKQVEEEYNILKNSTDIIKALSNAGLNINNDDECIIDSIDDVVSTLDSVSDVYPAAVPLIERINSVKIELADIASELSHHVDSMEIDEQRMDYVFKRHDTIINLKRKYNMEFNDIINLLNDSQKEISDMECSSEMIDKLAEQKEKLLEDVTEKAKKLYLYRKKTAENFIARVTEELRFLDMPNVIIDVKHEKGKLSINGMDTVEFLISANKGEEPKPIAKIASGGELSRIMLALKTVIADKDDIPTLIFDEIDTGVSGRAAQKIGIKLQEISSIRQVLCVTHLSQIAVMGDNHLLIEKKTVGDRTVTDVTELDFNGRVSEVARIMGGENPSELMIKNAQEQLVLNARK